MKVTVEIDCTPAEARSFFGLPDLAPLNERLMNEMLSRAERNMGVLQPEELVKSWMTWGGQAQDQFRRMMTATVGRPDPATPPADERA